MNLIEKLNSTSPGYSVNYCWHHCIGFRIFAFVRYFQNTYISIYKLQESLLAFFEIFHLEEVSTVVIAHLLTYKKLKNMEILKAVVLHLVIGFALTFYGGLITSVMDLIGVGGGLSN